MNRYVSGGDGLAGAGGERYTVQAAVKTLEVLFAFRGATSPLVVPDVARRLGMTRNQVYRCLKTLATVGLVREGLRGFTLTERVLELVSALDQESLAAIAEPFLLALRDESGETINLVVPADAFEVQCIATYPTAHRLGLVTRVGSRSYLHGGAVAKALLAHMPAAAVERFLCRLPSLPRYTDHTIVDPGALRAELARIRARGCALSDQDFEDGGRGIGAPIFGPDGQPMGGVSLGGPISRVDENSIDRLARLTMSAAAAISHRLGYRGEATPCGRRHLPPAGA